MRSLIVIKKPATIEYSIVGRNKAMCEQVVGVQAPQDKARIAYGYRLGGDESEEELRLGSDQLDRVAAFFIRTQTVSPDRRPYYNCHLFTSFVMAMTTDLADTTVCQAEIRGETSPYRLLRGAVYGTKPWYESINHTLLATGSADSTLSVYGINRPMMVAPIEDVMATYDADSLQQLSLLPSITVEVAPNSNIMVR